MALITDHKKIRVTYENPLIIRFQFKFLWLLFLSIHYLKSFSFHCSVYHHLSYKLAVTCFILRWSWIEQKRFAHSSLIQSFNYSITQQLLSFVTTRSKRCLSSVILYAIIMSFKAKNAFTTVLLLFSMMISTIFAQQVSILSLFPFFPFSFFSPSNALAHICLSVLMTHAGIV